MLSFIFFKDTHCSKASSFYHSHDWAKLTVDRDLSKFFNFKCYEYSKDKLYLPERFKFITKEDTPFFCVENDENIYSLGSLDDGRNFELLKASLLKMALKIN